MNKDFIYMLNNVINTLFMFCTYIYIFFACSLRYIITITIENN